MKTNRSKQPERAFTLIELLVVIAVLAIFAAMIDIGPPSGTKAKARRIICMNNLKQASLAYRIWSGDNGDKYPIQISVTNGGTMELINTPDAWKVFQVMSNEWSTPRILVCPADLTHAAYATNWGDNLKDKISYFIGLDTTDTNSTALLAGDDNFILNNLPAKSGQVSLTSSSKIEWDANRHVQAQKFLWVFKTEKPTGNIALADGSVQSVSSPGLTSLLRQTGLATNRLVIP